MTNSHVHAGLDNHDDDHDQGLGFDLLTLSSLNRAANAAPFAQPLGRRNVLKWFGAGSLVAVGATSLLANSRAAAAGVTAIPEETAGPYPGDGSNGPNALTQSGIVRSDIRSSFGSSTNTAAGVLTTVTLTITDTATGGTVEGLAVYLWQCNRDGQYSMYSQSIKNENYLRGVQVTDANGQVTFTTIYPACYDGRWPHMHFEVYPSVNAIISASNKLATSQLAMPEVMSRSVYATSGYSSSVSNINKVSLTTDMVFSDGYSTEMPAATGDPTNGVVLTLTVPVNANGNGTTGGTTTPTVGDTTITPATTPATVGVTSAFVPLAGPQRLMDTRTGSKPAAGSTTTLAVLGQAGIPSSGVTAVVLNLTGTEATAPGYVTVFPEGGVPTASSLNLETTGQTRANLVTVPVGSDGSVRIFSQSGTHLVADVFGYFEPASNVSAGRLITLTPGRLLDTRTGTKPAAQSTTTVAVLGQQGVPASGVSAVVVNIAATEATAAGYVTAFPSGSVPSTSNLNVESAAQTISNQAIIPVGADGSIRLYTQNGTHLVVDVAGYYTDSTASASASGLFIPVSPYRIADTRPGGALAAGATLTVLAAASGTAAAGMNGLAMNVTATEAIAAGFITVWPESTRPTASSLNVASARQTISNHVLMATGDDGGIRVFTQSGSHIVVDVTGWYQ